MIFKCKLCVAKDEQILSLKHEISVLENTISYERAFAKNPVVTSPTANPPLFDPAKMFRFFEEEEPQKEL